jgi:hypothetical protein
MFQKWRWALLHCPPRSGLIGRSSCTRRAREVAPGAKRLAFTARANAYWKYGTRRRDRPSAGDQGVKRRQGRSPATRRRRHGIRWPCCVTVRPILTRVRARSCTSWLRIIVLPVVYLPTADKYCRLTHQSSKGQKGLCEGLSWHPSVPLPPGGALEAGRVDARRLLRPPPLAASHHSACSHPCWLRPGRHTEEQHLAQRPDVIGQPRGHGRRLGLPAFG